MGDQGNTVGGFGVGLIVGAVVGTGLALLYAPYPGRRTRRLIRTKFDQALDNGIYQVEETQEQINEMAEKAQKFMNEVFDTAEGKGLSENNLGI
ncbi:MAG: YtxH domain-containing protein [Dehalogenimonas sp.]